MSIKVSVCTITYNHEAYIAEAVESALKQQTNFEYEIVIGEDCSTDRTRQILTELRDRHPDKIHLLLQEKNLGPNRNMVDVLKLCRGQYVAFLDGDDYWTCSHKLQRQVDFLDAHPQVAICAHRYRLMYNNDPQDLKNHDSPREKEIGTLGDFLNEYYVQPCTMMVRRCLIQVFPDWIYDIKSLDTCLQVFCLQHGDVGFINEVMAVYRIHQDGIWSGSTREERLKWRIVAHEALNKHLSWQYNRVFKQKISQDYEGLCWIYEGSGDLRQARRCLVKAVRYLPSSHWLSKQSILLAVRVWLPHLYALLRACKRGLSSRRR